MKKDIISVPQGVRFLSEWKDFVIPDFPCIIDKKIPGCGFTEYCLTDSEDIILCSPRKLLLANKEEQHPGEVLYVRNELDQDETIDKDLEKINRGSAKIPTKRSDITTDEERKRIIENLKNQIKSWKTFCNIKLKPCKIIVTYDSFRLVKETLGECVRNFRVVVDEFQSIFTDSRFKASTELEFVYQLQDLQKVCYVSATPMIDEYLEQIDEFKDLPYIELDWVTLDPFRVKKPNLIVKGCRSVNEPAYEIIKEYLNNNFESVSYKDDLGNIQVVESKEAVFYVNSVTNILGIIKKCGLKPEQCNILIADTPDNVLKLKRRLGSKWEIGDIPLLGKPHKMFTFCTRTVYLGADFYSTNARTFVLSDANIETLAVDISLDLPQILGRQRNNENPWKNRAEFYFKSSKLLKNRDEFNAYILNKDNKTYSLLKAYKSSDLDSSDKHNLAEEYLKLAQAFNYKSQYVAVNTHAGKVLEPVFNNLVRVAEQRAFDIQQIDYKDRFNVFSSLESNSLIDKNDKVIDFLFKFDSLKHFPDKMKLLCENDLSEKEVEFVLDQVLPLFKSYYLTLGPERCKALCYRKGELDKEINSQKTESSDDFSSKIFSEFNDNGVYTRKEIKEKLCKIYNELGLTKTPKATDLENYFDMKSCQVTIDKIRINCFKLIKKKGE